MHLKNWTATRSGANIRVAGFDTEKQEQAKLTAVKIEPRRGGLVIATDKDGNEHTLDLAA